jgi:hypothetical protein
MKRIIAITLSIEIFAQNHSGTGAPATSPVTSSLPSSTFLSTDGTLPSSSILAAPPYSDSSHSHDIESEDCSVLFAGGTEGGGNPQKMPVSGGYIILILLVVGYGIVRRRELRVKN